MEALTGKRLRPLSILPHEWSRAESVPDDAAHTLMQILESIGRYRLLILRIVAAGALLAVIGSFFMTPSYMAMAQLALNPRAAGATDGVGGAGAPAAGSDEATIDTHVTVLVSDGYLRRLLPALRALDVGRQDAAGSANPIRRVWAAFRDACSNITGLFAARPQQPSEGAALGALKAHLKVSQERRSRIISVIFTDTDPMRAANVANLIARSYVDELIRQKQAIETQALDAITAQSSAIQRELATTKQEFDDSHSGPPSPARDTTLESRLTSLAQQFETLLRRRQDLTTKGVAADPEVSLLAEATPPESPNSLNALLLVPPVTVAFGLFACLLAMVLYRLDRSLHTEAEATEALRLPCVGLIPSIPLEMSKPPRRISAPALGAHTEAIRSVVVSLLAASPLNSRAQQVVLVTSSVRGEGKTAISWSFAYCAAQLGRRVLLLDLGDSSGQPRSNAADLVRVLASDRPLLHAIRPVQELGIDCLPAGLSERNCLTLLAHPKMPTLLEQLKETYDLVVIDAPALQDAPEVGLLALWTDHVLLTVLAGQTRRDLVQSKLHRLARTEELVAHTQFWSVLMQDYLEPALSNSDAPARSPGMMLYQRMREGWGRMT